MGIQKSVEAGVEALFKELKDAVHDGEYIVTSDDGWGNVNTNSDPNIRVILDQFRQEDVETTSFSELIQPTDTKALVPGKDLTLTVKATGTKLRVEERTFTVEAFDTDPLKALYTFLLRDV